jgi:hypothetical protein
VQAAGNGAFTQAVDKLPSTRAIEQVENVGDANEVEAFAKRRGGRVGAGHAHREVVRASAGAKVPNGDRVALERTHLKPGEREKEAMATVAGADVAGMRRGRRELDASDDPWVWTKISVVAEQASRLAGPLRLTFLARRDGSTSSDLPQVRFHDLAHQLELLRRHLLRGLLESLHLLHMGPT